MANQTVELQAREYVYDLNNCAKENGFKADEGWEISLASTMDKLAIENQYYPTMSVKVLPEILTEMLHLVKSKLVRQGGNGQRYGGDSLGQNTLQYLVAYNPGRVRR